MAPERILYFWHYDAAAAPLWNGPFFRTAGPALPADRLLQRGLHHGILLVQPHPAAAAVAAGESGAFGIFALSGTATMWLGSFLVHYATATFHSQQAGMGPSWS